jgi:hypothetical protein
MIVSTTSLTPAAYRVTTIEAIVPLALTYAFHLIWPFVLDTDITTFTVSQSTRAYYYAYFESLLRTVLKLLHRVRKPNAYVQTMDAACSSQVVLVHTTAQRRRRSHRTCSQSIHIQYICISISACHSDARCSPATGLTRLSPSKHRSSSQRRSRTTSSQLT